jgi:hypothetical protein
MEDAADLRRTMARAPDYVGRQVADEYVLVPLRRHASECARIFTLNPVAGRIWELLDGERDLAAVAETLCREFEVEAERAEADVRTFVGQLEEIAAVTAV